jgi:DnaK suppressor protein
MTQTHVHLTEERLQEYLGVLEAERDALTEELGEKGANVGGDWEGSSFGAMQGEEADSSDAADQIEELVTNVPLVEELETRLKEINAALSRMKKGTFGICAECGKPIDEDRLEANPAAATCVAHA